MIEDVLDEQNRLAKIKHDEMVQRYRNTFNSEEGRRVLGDILLTCHWGVPLNTEQERYEYNVGVTIARMCGIMSDIDAMVGIRED